MLSCRLLPYSPDVAAFVKNNAPFQLEHEPDQNLVRYGAFHGDHLVAVIGWYEGLLYRFVDEWADTGTRHGRKGSAMLVRLARQRRVLGHVAPENKAALSYIKKNGGTERAVLVDLPPLGA